MSDDKFLGIGDISIKVLALHLAGRDAEALDYLDSKTDDSYVSAENACLYTILGQTGNSKVKSFLSDMEDLAAYSDSDESISDELFKSLSKTIMDLSDTPLIDLTEFKKLIQTK